MPTGRIKTADCAERFRRAARKERLCPPTDPFLGIDRLVAFGRHFISNPDLPERLRRGLPLNRYDRTIFYGGDRRGHVDYPPAEVASAA
jgi:hypothetical protein